jgi:tetratricopeptide (TPR) repeat protein
MKDFDKAVEANPNYVNAYTLRGMVDYGRKEYDEAVKDFTKAIAIYPFHALYYMRANCHFSKGRYDQAVTDMNSAISQVPAFAGYYLGRSQSYYSLKQYAKAKADAKTCVQLGGQIPPQYQMMLNQVGNQ